MSDISNLFKATEYGRADRSFGGYLASMEYGNESGAIAGPRADRARTDRMTKMADDFGIQYEEGVDWDTAYMDYGLVSDGGDQRGFWDRLGESRGNLGPLRSQLQFTNQTNWDGLMQEQKEDVLEGFAGVSQRGYNNLMQDLTFGREFGTTWAPLTFEGSNLLQEELFAGRDRGVATNLRQAFGDIAGVLVPGAENVNHAKIMREAILSGKFAGETVQDVVTGEVFAWGDTDNSKRIELFAKQGPQQNFLVERAKHLGIDLSTIEGKEPGAWQADLINKSNAAARANASEQWWKETGWVGKSAYFGQMLVAEVLGDPDETYLTAATLGFGTAAKLATGAAYKAGSAALQAGVKVATKGGSRAAISGLNAFARGANRVGDVGAAAQRWTNVSEFGGTVAESIFARSLTNIGAKSSVYVGGLAADGLIQGSLFYGYNSAAMVETAVALYGNSQGREATAGGYVTSALLGGALSVGIGAGAGRLADGAVAATKWDINQIQQRWAKKLEGYGDFGSNGPSLREQEVLKAIYGENAPAGVRAQEAIAMAQQDSAWALATLTGQEGNPQDMAVLGLAQQAGIPIRDTADFLITVAGSNEPGTVSTQRIQYLLAEHVKENADPANTQVTPEMIEAKADLFADSVVIEAHEAGMADPRIDPSLEGDARVEAVRNVNTQRAEAAEARLEQRRERIRDARRENDRDADMASRDEADNLYLSVQEGGPTVTELRLRAKAAGVAGYSSMNRNALVDAIAAAEASPESASARADAEAKAELVTLQRASQLDSQEAKIDAEQAKIDSDKKDIAEGKYDDKPYAPSVEKLKEAKREAAEADIASLKTVREAAQSSESVSSETLGDLFVHTDPETPSGEISGPEAAKMIDREIEAIREDAEKIEESDLSIQAVADVSGGSYVDFKAHQRRLELAAARREADKGATPNVMGAPDKFRAGVVRTTATAVASTLRRRKAALDAGRTWSVAEDITAMNVARARLEALNYRAEEGVQILSYDAVKALFRDTALADIAIETVFADAKTNDGSMQNALFSADLIIREIETRLASVDPEFRASLLPERQAEAARNPYLVERRVYEALSVHHAARAKAEFEAAGGKLKGAESEPQWVYAARQHFVSIMGKRAGKSGEFTKVLERLGITPEDFANGTIDYLDPRTFAEGLAEVAMGKREGTIYHREVVEEMGEDGTVEVKERMSAFPESRNSVMPYSARQWVERYEDAVAFHRRRAILDWNPETGMSREEVREALTSKLNKGVALDPRKVHKFGGRLIPAELFTNPDKELMSIDELVEKTQIEMLEMDATDYDMIHDDFGTRAGEWGVPADYESGRYFENTGFAGGFPLATILPSPDGSRSMGMAVLDAHTLLFPEMMFEAREASLARGEEAAARGVEPYMGRNIDGAQNGVRHALAFAYADQPEVQAMIGAVDKDVDFYVSVRDTTAAQLRESDSPIAKWWLSEGPFADEAKGRKFSKKPVMTKPYGAGKKALRSHILSYVMDLPAEVREKINVNETVDFLTNMWHGNKKEKEAGILNEALGLPENEEFLARLAKRVSDGELHPNLDSPREMMDFALRMEEQTGVSVDTWLMALQMQKAAEGMGLTKKEVQAVWRQNMTALADPMSVVDYRSKSQGGEFTLFEQVMSALNRTPFEIDPEGNAAFTRDLTGQDATQLERRLARESDGQFFWTNMIDYRTRMYVDSVLMNPKGAKAGRHALTLELLPEAEGFRLKDGVTPEQWEKFVSDVNNGRRSRSEISELVVFEGLGGNMRMAQDTRSVRKRLEDEHGAGTPEFEAAMKEERDRVETLVLKQVMLDAHADFIPPVLERDLNETEFVDLDAAFDRSATARHEAALDKFEGLTPEEQEAYIAHVGLPKFDPRRSAPITREEFDGMDLELRRSVAAAQGLHQLDTEMENRPLHTVIGIPGLAAAAKRATTRETVAQAKGLGGPSRVESADAAAKGEDLPVRTNMVDTTERLLVDHTDSDMLPDLEMSYAPNQHGRELSPEQEEALVKMELAQYARTHGLEKELAAGDYGFIWARRHIEQQVKAFDAMYRKARRLAKTPADKAEVRKRFAKLWREWQDGLQAPSRDVISGEFNTLTIDPAGAISVVPGVDKDGNRLSMAQQLERSSRRGGNVEAVTGQTSPMGLRQQPLDDPRLGEGEATQPIFIDAVEGMTADGNVIPAPNTREENTKAPVHVIHGTDAAAIRLAVALREGLDPTDALNEQTLVMSLEELQAGLQLGFIQGADVTTRFFTKDGVEVVMPIVQGRNARRALSRGERFNVMMQTKNQFLARRLDLAAKLELEGLSVKGDRTMSSALDAEKTDPVVKAAQDKEQMELRVLRSMGDELVNGPGAYDSLSGSIQPRWYVEGHRHYFNDGLEAIGLANLNNRFGELGFVMEIDTRDFALREKGYLIGGPGKNKKGLVYEAEQAAREADRDPKQAKITVGEMDSRLKSAWAESPLRDKFFSILFDGDTIDMSRQFTTVEIRRAWAAAEKAELSRLRTVENHLKMASPEARTAAALVVGSKMHEGTAALIAGVDNADKAAEMRMAINYLRRMEKQVGAWEFQGANGWAGIEAAIKLMETHPDALPLKAPESKEAREAEIKWLNERLRGTAGLASGKLSTQQGALLLARARQALEEANSHVATTNNNIEPWQTFTDVDGRPQSPEWFMEADNYETIGEGHAQFNAFLEEGIASGAIDVPTARMLRVATAGTDDAFLASLGFGWMDKDQLSDRELAQNVWGRAFTTTGQVGLQIRKDILGTKGSLGLVDVILHEIGHGGVETFVRGNRIAAAEAMALISGPEGEKVMRDMVKQMYGGKWTREAQNAFDYFTKSKHGKEEFLAQLFSFTMMARTLDDHRTVSKAFAADSTGTLQGVIQKIASYVYRKVSKIAAVLRTTDPSIKAKIDFLVDTMNGNTAAIPQTEFTPNMVFHSKAEPEIIPGTESSLDRLAELHALESPTFEQAIEMRNLTTDVMLAAQKDQQYHVQTRTPESMDADPAFRDDDGVVQWDLIKDDPEVSTHFVVGKIEEQMSGNMLDPRGTGSLLSGLLADGSIGGSASWKISKVVMAHSNWHRTMMSEDALTRFVSSTVDHQSIYSSYNPATGEHVQSLEQVKQASIRSIQDVQIALKGLRAKLTWKDGKVKAIGKKIFQSEGLTDNGVRVETAIVNSITKGTTLSHELDASGLSPEFLADIMSDIEDVHKKLTKVSKQTVEMMVENGTIDKDIASRLPGLPLKLNKENLAGNPDAVEQVLEGFKQLVSERLQTADRVDHMTLQLLGFMPLPDQPTLKWWDGDRVPEKARTEIENLGLNALAYSEKARLEKRGIPADVTQIKRRLHAEAAIQPATRRAMVEAGLNKFRHKISKRELTKAEFFGSDTASLAMYQNGITSNRDYVPGAQVLLEQSAAGKDKGVTSPATTAAEAHAFRTYSDLQRTGRFVRDNALVTHAEVESNPLIAPYLSKNILELTDGMRKGVIFDELSKRAMARGLGVKGMTHKDLMDLAEQVMIKNHPARAHDIHAAFDSYRESYEHAAGRRQSFAADHGHVAEWLGRNASSLAMAKYGKNLGFAQGAETVQAFADRARLTGSAPGFVAGIASLFDGLGPRARAELGRNLNFTMAHIHSEMNTRITGTRDESTAPKGRMDRILGKIGDLSTKYGGAYFVQRFNKTYAAATANQLQLRDMDAAVKLAEALEKEGDQISPARFKQLASEAGFGRRWSDAQRWRENGLLNPAMAKLAREILTKSSGKYNSRMWSPDDAQVYVADHAGHSSHRDMEMVFQSLMDMMEDYVSKINIEPRLMDTNLSEGGRKAWGRIMDVYLAWPRAFYSQRIARSGRYSAIELSNLIGAQYIWDTMYRAVRSMTGGSLAADLVHEWENDPVGMAASNAFMLPVLGGWTWLPQALLDVSRDFAAGSGIGFGYSNPNAWRMSIMSSPAGAAANSIAQLGLLNVKSIMGLATGEMTVDKLGLNLLSQAQDYMPLVNNMAISALAQQYIAQKTTKSYARRGYERYYDYLTRLHAKRARKRWGRRGSSSSGVVR